MALSCNYYAVKMQRLDKIVAQKKLQKCPKGQVMAIFETSPKTRFFLNSAKGGPRKIFKKLGQKGALA